MSEEQAPYPFRMTQKDVLEAVMLHCASIHPYLEIDREWIWYCGPSLQGEVNKPTREAMKRIGFRYRFKGARELPSGKVGTWAHHCMRPTPRGSKGETAKQPGSPAPTERDRTESLLASIDSMFG